MYFHEPTVDRGMLNEKPLNLTSSKLLRSAIEDRIQRKSNSVEEDHIQVDSTVSS